MPELTRRRSTDAREECWHVYYDDVLAVQSRSAAATRMTKTRGNCIAASIRALTQANIRTEPPPASTKPAPISKPRGRFFWRSEPRLTFRRGVASKLDRSKICDASSRRKTTIAETKHADGVCGQDLCNGVKNQHGFQDHSDSAIKSGLGGNDNVQTDQMQPWPRGGLR